MSRNLTRRPLPRAVAVASGVLLLAGATLAGCSKSARPAAPAATSSTTVIPTVEYFSYTTTSVSGR